MNRKKSNPQELFWKKGYAENYIRKNKNFEQKKGIEAWKLMLRKTKNVSTILECGCNIGRNIGFLEKVLPNAEKSIIEVSLPAFKLVQKNHKLKKAFYGSIMQYSFKEKFDLVFTMGVLIHIHPNELEKNLKKIYDFSKKYILIGEYFNRTPVMLDYQGRKDKLFKMDFGKNFINYFPLRVLDYGFLWGHFYDDAGFDDITWWLFEKVKI